MGFQRGTGKPGIGLEAICVIFWHRTWLYPENLHKTELKQNELTSLMEDVPRQVILVVTLLLVTTIFWLYSEKEQGVEQKDTKYAQFVKENSWNKFTAAPKAST